MKNITIVALVALMLLTAALPANAAIKATSVEVRGSVVTNDTVTHNWTNATFAGFYYDIDDDIGTETLRITTSGSDNRTIAEDALTYSTSGQAKALKVVTAKYATGTTTAASDGLEEFAAGDMATVANNYTIVGWQAEPYVAIKGKVNKLSKLLVEHGTSSAEKKTLTVGETWEIGGGYTLTANSIDAKATPRQVWLTLNKDGVKKDDKVVTSGGTDSTPIYTYVEKSLCGETDVPIFVTYVDSVFAGATTDMVQFRYTWLINPTCTEVKSSDVFGSLKVVTTTPTLTLNNSDTTITLSVDSTQDVMGNIKLKVADSTTLRFYPYVLKTTPGTYEVRGKVVTNDRVTHDWTNATFAGFYYDIDDNIGTETLRITTSGSDNRTIAEDALTYSTSGQAKALKVVTAKYATGTTTAASDGLEEFAAGDMATVANNYTIVGWQAEPYVAIKGKVNKLSKLLVEHGTSSAEKKTLTVGETWEIGGGYTLTANSIDAKATPRQVWLTLNKDGVKKDDKVVTSGGTDSTPIYTYVEKSLCGETDVPIFVTYVDSVFAGATTDMVQFRYTWLINPTCTEVKSSDVFGSLKVVTTTPTLTLNNSDTTITLSVDSTQDVMGGIRLKVADSTTLRYYPFVEYQIGEPIVEPNATPRVTGTVTPPKTPNETVTTPPVGITTTGVPPTAGTPAATTTKKEPGFEAIFAIAGLLAVAFLVLRQRK
jgi:S-layer protein (TIGR01567 family)